MCPGWGQCLNEQVNIANQCVLLLVSASTTVTDEYLLLLLSFANYYSREKQEKHPVRFQICELFLEGENNQERMLAAFIPIVGTKYQKQ